MVERKGDIPDLHFAQLAQAHKPRFHRCTNCRYVLGPNDSAPVRCPQCMTDHPVFTPTEIFFPDPPSAEAIERDTSEVETAIRAVYINAARKRAQAGHVLATIVPLADIREGCEHAIPSTTRETIDAALTKLAMHPDVHIGPATDQKQATPDMQRAALGIGGDYSHTILIETRRPAMEVVLQCIGSTTFTRAMSVLTPLCRVDLMVVASWMGVEHTDDLDVLRTRIAEASAANRRAWLNDAEQAAADGHLLRRADTDPEWVATWTDEDRIAASSAANRLLTLANRDAGWAYIRTRAARWL